MTLPELCEPLFQYLCRLNRAARKGGSLELPVVRKEIKALFASLRTQAATAQELARQYGQVETALVFFVDSMVSESGWNISKDWNRERLAYEDNELAGDEKFFDLLEETLQDTSEQATERLVVFYTCLGLGFTGWYTGKPDYLRKKMKEVSARIKNYVKFAERSRICPEAYENVDGRDLIAPPSRKLVGIAVGVLGMIVVLFVTNALLFHDAASQLVPALKTIIEHAPAAAPTP